MPEPVTGTIVMPVLNESEGIEVILSHLMSLLDEHWQVLVVDGGSSDDTLLRLRQFPVKVISSETGRACQMNAGANHASGDLIVFLHADTQLPREFCHLMNHFFHSEEEWGRFDVNLDNPRWYFVLISWFINQRSRMTGICTGDQCLFMQRDFFARLAGFDNIPLMEDVEFTIRARKASKPYCVGIPVLTSARRWMKHGIVKTVLLMWWLRFAYRMGVSPRRLHSWYYGQS